MKAFVAALAGLAATAISLPAQAVTVVATYRATIGEFVPTMRDSTMDFTLVYDPSASGTGAVTGWATTLANPAFSQPVAFDAAYGPHTNCQSACTTASYTTLSIGGADLGALDLSPTSDFRLSFAVDSAGRLFPSSFTFGNGLLPIAPNLVGSGTAGVPYTANVALLSVTAVPEPSMWAMMILGLGIAGGALRRRRTVRAAFAG